MRDEAWAKKRKEQYAETRKPVAPLGTNPRNTPPAVVKATPKKGK